MPLQVDIPPRIGLAKILRSIVLGIPLAAHRFNSGASVLLEPGRPRFFPENAPTVSPERMNMMPIAGRIRLNRIKVRDPDHLAHVPLERTPGRVHPDHPLEGEGRHDLPVCKAVNPLNALQFIKGKLQLPVILATIRKDSFNTAIYRGFHNSNHRPSIVRVHTAGTRMGCRAAGCAGWRVTSSARSEVHPEGDHV